MRTITGCSRPMALGPLGGVNIEPFITTMTMKMTIDLILGSSDCQRVWRGRRGERLFQIPLLLLLLFHRVDKIRLLAAGSS